LGDFAIASPLLVVGQLSSPATCSGEAFCYKHSRLKFDVVSPIAGGILPAMPRQKNFLWETIMVARSLLLCLSAVLLPANVWAQDAGSETAANQPLTRDDFNKLTATLETLTSSIQQMRVNTTADIAELRKEIEDLKSAQQAIIDQQKDQGTTLSQITMQSETGSRYLRFDTNSQPARDELKRAIESTIPETGTFIIKNKTPNHQYIVVNDGEPRHIWPYDEEQFQVKPGAVTSRILNRQRQQTYTWHVGVPEFRRVIELVDRTDPVIPQVN
jgi:hypothetical protein